MNQFTLQTDEKHFVVRGNQRASGIISPIERWPDQNYVPHALDTLCVMTPTDFQIVAGLHGYAATDVQVDLARGCVIILIARGEHAPTNQPLEYYCEVPIPARTKSNVAQVAIDGDFVMVRLARRQPSLIERAIAEFKRLKNDSALLLGSERPIRLFDDSPCQPPVT